jgi:hypothetical protein
MTVPQPVPPPCGVCGRRAACAYSYGAGEMFACVVHDPTHQPGWMTTTLGCNFTYRTLPQMVPGMVPQPVPGVAPVNGLVLYDDGSWRGVPEETGTFILRLRWDDGSWG